MMNEKIKLDNRLLAVASQVRQGVRLYDVGSDHAYLPAYLLQEGKITFAVVSDIAEGPLSRAEKTVKAAGVSEKVTLRLTSGLDGTELVTPCDVSIAGMGGELICDIISAKPELKNGDISLILQPMTRAETLRAYLCENGFTFDRELTVKEGKLYTVIVCRYSGEREYLTETELILGKEGVRTEDEAFFALVKQKLDIYSAIAEGKRSGGHRGDSESGIASALKQILDNGGNGK